MPSPSMASFTYAMDLLDQILARKPKGTDMQFPTWNNAVSAEAQLNRYKKHITDSYTGSLAERNPFNGLSMQVIRPNILRFRWDDLGVHITDIPPSQEMPKIVE